MINYNLYLNDKLTTTFQASSRKEAVILAQAFKTHFMQRIHVEKPQN